MSEPGKKSLVLAIVGALAVVALASSAGFYYFEKAGTPTLTFWDSIWWAMVTMTTIGYGDIYPRTFGGRAIALFLMFAGIGTLSFLTAAIASYFIRADGWQKLRLNRFHHHVIICGLGKKGLMLTRAFRALNRDVVVLEEDEGNDAIGVARDLGAVVLVGDAREKALLKTAGIERAQYIISLCGGDGVNAEVAARSRDFAKARTEKDPLICSVHIVDPELWYLLREWEMSGTGEFRLQFFNIVDTAARALLDEHPAFTLPVSHPPHLLLVGAGRLSRSLLVHIARAWHDAYRGEASTTMPRLRCILIDKEASSVVSMMHLRHPELEAACQITALAMDVTEPEFHRASFLFDADGQCLISKAYVCLPDDAAGLSASLALHGRLRHLSVPIIATMDEESGLTTLLNEIRGAQRRFENLHAIGLMERACQPDLVLGGIPELLARALHERYIEEQESLNVKPEDNSLMVPWDELPEDARESNRTQALHIGEKLAAIGCDIAPLTDWNAATHQFAEDEVELMAVMEHKRWLSERFAQGWSLGPRDPSRKKNPNLLEWEQLPENVRVYNRGVVRDIPLSLAHAGFQIFRLKPRLDEPVTDETTVTELIQTS